MIVRLTQRNLRIMAYLDRLNQFTNPQDPDQKATRVFFSDTGYHTNAIQIAGIDNLLAGLNSSTVIYLPENEGEIAEATCAESAQRLTKLLAKPHQPIPAPGCYLFGVNRTDPLLQLRRGSFVDLNMCPSNVFFTELEESCARNIDADQTEIRATTNIFTVLAKLGPQEYRAIRAEYAGMTSSSVYTNPIVDMYNVAAAISTSSKSRTAVSNYPESPTCWL